MTIKFLGQGYEAASEDAVGKYLARFFADKQFHSFFGITAFTSVAGVELLDSCMKKGSHFKNISLITGVDQKGTSKEALQALLERGISSYVFFVPPPSPIFHPKLYLFQGEKRSELIIGSSNLTAPGLFANVETSMLISIKNSVTTDKKTVSDLKKYFAGLFNYNDLNLQPLNSELIAKLVKDRIVPTEAERRALHEKDKTNKTTAARNELLRLFPKRPAAKVPTGLRANKKAKPRTVRKTIPAVGDLQLLWESGPLKKRDLTIPERETTNPTGSMLFKKGKTKGIDQRHYFRNKVFSSLNWVANTRKGSTHLEKAKAFFRIIVLGEDFGTFHLTLTHDPRTNTRSYEENNSMTSISWGIAKPIIATNKLIGRNAKLYRSRDNKEGYVLIIE